MRDEELRKALIRTLEVLSETLRLLEDMCVEDGRIVSQQRVLHHAEVVSRLAKELSS